MYPHLFAAEKGHILKLGTGRKYGASQRQELCYCSEPPKQNL